MFYLVHIYILSICLHFCAVTAELSTYDMDSMACKLKIFTL